MNLRRSGHQDEAELSTESLNDIMFFLLLFFLIISTLANPNVIKILLPGTKESTQVTRQPITLSVTGDLRYYINQQEIPSAELEGELARRAASVEDLSVVVRMDKDLTVQTLADIQQICARLNLKMVLATTKK